MTRRPDHEDVERRFRAIIADAGLPAPDDVTHWTDAVAFYWRATKAVVIVDLDEVEFDGEMITAADPDAALTASFPDAGLRASRARRNSR